MGSAWYETLLAKNEKALAEGNYEYYPILEWLTTDANPQAFPMNAPGEEFAVLSSGKSFEVESLVVIIVQRTALSPLKEGIASARKSCAPA